MTAIVWFRRDLRVADHPALARAAVEGRVLPVFVDDRERQRPTGEAARRRLDASLAALSESTDGTLVRCIGEPAAVLSELAARSGADRVHVTADLTPDGLRRDAAVARRLAEQGVELARSDTAYAIAPGTLRSSAGTPYQVFTPFSRAWRDQVVLPPHPVPTVRWLRAVEGEPLPSHDPPSDAGEAAALTRWHEFLDFDLAGYAAERDRPDLDTTSRMSAHLAWGEIHPRTMLADLATHPDGGSEGAQRFVGELCWREFCADVLWHHPGSAWSDLRPGPSDDGAGSPDGRELDAWRTGRTGFPFVDAGMRQLRAEGWLHNRVRMVVASFLVKDLHVRWQVGAQHFLDHLVDADLASNTGNWQWVAGTGTDAAPYFRVFNPVRQGLRFDPDGEYVRRWIPELSHLAGWTAHVPWREPAGYDHGYPERIVDHDEERRVALERYARARAGG